MSRIVVATRPLEEPGGKDETLRAGLDLGDRFRLPVEIVAVVPVTRLVTARRLVEDLDALEVTLIERATTLCNPAYRLEQLAVRVTVLRGPLIARLSVHVERAPTRLIVIGDRGPKPWWSLRSSTAQRVARAISCPVYLAR